MLSEDYKKNAKIIEAIIGFHRNDCLPTQPHKDMQIN